MQGARVVRGEVLAAIRKQGIRELAEVEAVVLETDGQISVVRASRPAEDAAGTSLDDLPVARSASER